MFIPIQILYIKKMMIMVMCGECGASILRFYLDSGN